MSTRATKQGDNMDIYIGKALKYGDNINTDIISPPQYMELGIKEASAYSMSAIDPDFSKRVRPGDFFVAENNLGSGSSRETSPLTLKYLGIKCVIARSFARIFYRNCINVGIPALVCPQSDRIEDGDELKVDISGGRIINETKSESYDCEALPEHIMSIIEAGGLFLYLKKQQER